jgi:hypothetical protein
VASTPDPLKKPRQPAPGKPVPPLPPPVAGAGATPDVPPKSGDDPDWDDLLHGALRRGPGAVRPRGRRKKSRNVLALFVSASLICVCATAAILYWKVLWPMEAERGPGGPIAAAGAKEQGKAAAAAPDQKAAAPDQKAAAPKASSPAAKGAAQAPGSAQPDTQSRKTPQTGAPASQSGPPRGASPAAPQGQAAMPDINVIPAKVEGGPSPPPAATPGPAAAKESAKEKDEAALRRGDEVLLDLYNRRRLLKKREYPTLRHIFAERFEMQHGDEIRKALGGSYDKTMAWLNAHAELKEELYTALSPARDRMIGAMTVFQDLLKRYPDQVAPYGELAIATAVTWCNPSLVYTNAGTHAYAQAVLPKGQLGALENFDYLVKAESVMQGRIRFMPWEFLVHVVNHRTSLVERKWALANYLPRRVMIGQCYYDVPYDYPWSQGKTPKLAGQQYTLENLLGIGGVCGVRADFACRVAKSIGVPAEWVSGTANDLESHAWVMWVELQSVTRTNISFSLKSRGRFFEDQYYVGQLRNPLTGDMMTDRQLELQLQTVGSNPQVKRQAVLVMKAYPMLRDKVLETPLQRLGFLTQVTQFCPGNEEAWITIAKMSRNDEMGKKPGKQMIQVLDRLFHTFAAFPDFTWVVFDDLASYEKLPKQHDKLYERLIGLYEQAGRPDLACEARLKYVAYLLKEDKRLAAVEGLASEILKFPGEGRYVPKLLDKIEAICRGGQVPNADECLVKFYQQFLPKIPMTNGGKANPYCVSMFKRAAAFFKKKGETQLADMCEAQLNRLAALPQ